MQLNGDYSLRWIATAKCPKWHPWTLRRFLGTNLSKPDFWKAALRAARKIRSETDAHIT